MQLDVILMPSCYPHWTSSDAPAAVDRDSKDLPAWMHHRLSPEKQKRSQQENSNCEWALAESSSRAMQKTCFSIPLLKGMNQTIQIHGGVCFTILVLRSETEVQDSKSGLLVLTNLNWKNVVLFNLLRKSSALHKVSKRLTKPRLKWILP